MAHDQNVGATEQVGNGSDRLHQNGTLLRVAEERRFLNPLFGFLALPDLVAEVVDHRVLELIVTLTHGRHRQPLHDAIGILHTIPETTGGRVDDNPIHRHTEVLEQNIDLLGQIDVDRRRGDQRMTVSHRRRGDTFVIFLLDGAEQQILVLAGLGHRFHNLFILGRCRASPDDERHLHGTENLSHRFRRRLGAGVLIVRVDALELQDDCLGAIVFNALFRPGGRVGNHILERGQGRLGPVRRLHVPYFHSNQGVIGHIAFKGVERVTCLATDSYSGITRTNGNRFDATGVGLLFNFKCHVSLL